MVLRSPFSSLLATLAVSLLTFHSANASAGAGSGGGGDICENRFKTVRDDIASWINKNGSSGLELSSGTRTQRYNELMLKAIAEAKISCTDQPVMVEGAEKTCKNFVAGGASRITCNAKRFLDTDESSQYVLVHHEYAGLTGIEINVGENSDYSVSNQLSAFLVDELVKKLAIAPRPQAPVDCSELDHTKPIRVGTKCITSAQGIFERVDYEGFGEAWKDPNGIIWSDKLGVDSYVYAEDICRKVGSIMPSAENLKHAEGHGLHEVLPHMENEYVWSNSPYTGAWMHLLVLSGDSGKIYQTSYEDRNSVRCIAYAND
ncbi:MAG: hypothetical protein ACJ763_04360 [Bdellovibrionia bacterium]